MGSPGERALILSGVVLILGALGLRFGLEGRRELSAADAAAARADEAGEVRHLRRAMAHYFPGSPWVDRARGRLLELAERAERRGDPARALAILHELRSAMLALRGASQPFGESLAQVNQRIAALTARTGALTQRAPEAAKRWLERLDQPPQPDRLWSVAGLLGFVLWLGGGALLLGRGLTADAALVRRRFWPMAALIGMGLLLFWLGLAYA